MSTPTPVTPSLKWLASQLGFEYETELVYEFEADRVKYITMIKDLRDGHMVTNVHHFHASHSPDYINSRVEDVVTELILKVHDMRDQNA